MKIRFLLSALLALSSINSFAVEVLDTVSVGGIRYVISATDIPSCKVVYSPEGYSGAVVIPERVSVDGTQYEVVSIAQGAFAFCKDLTSVQLPTTLRSVGKSAFAYCDRLEFLEIPEGVTTINMYAFAGCHRLRSLVLPSTLKMIGNKIIDCYSLSEVYFKSAYSPELIVENYDFELNNFWWSMNKSLYSECKIYVPKNCTDNYLYISQESRNADVLEYDYSNPVIPSSIPDSTLYRIRFHRDDDVDYKSAVLIDGIYYVITSQTDMTCKVVAGDYYYHDVVEVPASVCIDGVDYIVNEVSKYAFWNCRLITSITLPETIGKDINVEDIIYSDYYGNGIGIYQESRYFRDAEKSPSPEKYDLYQNNLYYKVAYDHAVVTWVDNLSSITVPETVMINGISYPVKSIDMLGPDVLYLSLPSGVSQINLYLNNIYSLCQVDLPEESSLTGMEFVRCSSLKAEDNVVYVGKSALWINERRSSSPLKIKDGTRYICGGAFAGSDIASVTLPESLKEIGISAFANCSNLESIEIPTGVTSAYLSSFSGCNKLKSVTFPSGCDIKDAEDRMNPIRGTYEWDIIWEDHFIQTHDERVYYNGYLDMHTMLSKAQIENLASFGVRFADNVSVIPDFFNDGRRLENMTGLVLGDSIKEVGNYAFWKSENLNEVVITGTPEIGAYAFGASERIEKVSVTSLVPPVITYIPKVRGDYQERKTEEVLVPGADYRNDSIAIVESVTGGRVTVLYGDRGLTDQWQAEFAVDYETPGTYDVYVVVLPNGILPGIASSKSNQFNCYLDYLDKEGNAARFTRKDPSRPTRDYKYHNSLQKADTIHVGQIEVFDNMPYGKENKLTVSIKINMTASETQSYSNTMLMDCVILDQVEQTATSKEMEAKCIESVFSKTVYENALLQVPAGSIDAYRNAPCWSLFSNIYEEGQVPTGVDTIVSDTSARVSEYYDLSGKRVNNPSVSGIYIQRLSDGRTKKIVIK
ncbi:MAG: leucine-rich repeat domain-containing protein [Bacteroidaceae bacterium]|nr:leucine-rich repeat domain-containing protein [Bacteroidaceae bacterium]